MESERASETLRIAVAVRDEKHRNALISILTGFDRVEVIALDAERPRALTKIKQTSPDVVFLDRSLLTLREMQAVRRMLEQGRPLIAFVMPRPQPVDAFEPNAIDYLILPTTRDRTRITLERVKDRLDAASFKARSHQLPRAPIEASPSGFLQRIPARTREGFRIIPVEKLIAVVAHGEYMHLTTTDGERHVILYRLKDLEARLDPAQFIRLSRSILVNINFVQNVAPSRSGLLKVSLTNGEHYEASRHRARDLRGWLLRL